MSTNPRIGPYELQQRLENYTPGECWKAFDIRQHLYVTLYILRVDTQVSPDATAQFYKKTHALTNLQHPNIAQVLDIHALQSSKSEHGVLVVTEYNGIGTLAEYFQSIATLTPRASSEALVSIFAGIGAAIDYIHEFGIIHGALKPSVILLDKQKPVTDPSNPPKNSRLLYQLSLPAAHSTAERYILHRSGTGSRLYR
jgi:serine/threonine protein kinase